MTLYKNAEEELLQQKILSAKYAIEDLIREVQKYHGCKGYGASKCVLIPLDFSSFSDGHVDDHLSIYYNNRTLQGIQICSYEYDFLDPAGE